MAAYAYELIGRLAQNCSYTPRKRRLEQLGRIQQLAASLQPAKTYPYDYVVYRITKFRPGDAPHAVFEAEPLRADLLNLLLDVSGSLDLPVAWANQPVLSVDEVCRTYDVSRKTVRRWRAAGLVALRLVFPGGRKRTAVRQSDLRAFVEAHPRTFRRTNGYLDDATRRRVIARAFELSLGEELSPAEAVGRLAQEFACPHEAVRDLLTRYDAEHAEAPIFGAAASRLTADERRQLVTLYRSGLPPHELARQFFVGRSTVGRVVRELITEEILGPKWEHVHTPDFDAPGAHETLLAEVPANEAQASSVTEPLTPDQEQALFRQYNFLKYQLAQAREELSPSDLGPEQLDRLVRLYDRTMAVRNRLVLANLRLVVHHAGRHVGYAGGLDELVSDGTVSLMQAIERFDFTRGVRFSTYASWAILKNYAKTLPHEAKARRAFTAESQETVEAAPDRRPAETGQRELRELLRSLVASMLLELSEREREIVVARFGLGGQEAETLDQIGRRYAITRERVRQIEARALRKLAAVADPGLLEELAVGPPSPPR